MRDTLNQNLTLGELKLGDYFTILPPHSFTGKPFVVIDAHSTITTVTNAFERTVQTIGLESDLAVRVLTDDEVTNQKMQPAMTTKQLTLGDLKKGDYFTFLYPDTELKKNAFRVLKPHDTDIKLLSCNYAFIFSDFAFEFHHSNVVRLLESDELFLQKVNPKYNSPDINSLLGIVKKLQQRLEQYINATPSGELRNTLTQENIDALLVIQQEENKKQAENRYAQKLK